jgi:nucleoside 2-deoxyribosyltransferase
MSISIKKLPIYMAGPLFTVAERRHNCQLANELRKLITAFEFILPQERAATFLPDLAAVVRDCLAQVRDADRLLACLDGADVDSGTCVEIGYAIALGKPILGYRTDIRGSEIEGVNAMVRYGCTDFILAPSIENSTEKLAAILAARLSGVTGKWR